MKKQNFFIEKIFTENSIVFCGAGISFNSGMPLAMGFIRYILKSLNCSSENIEILMNSNIPFELFMELISEETDITSLLKVFDNNNPNKNHYFLAEMAKKGKINTLITTNFDPLIEKALESQGLEYGVDYKVYYKDSHYKKIKWEKNIIHVIKIHGCINDTESIAVVMRKIASRSLIESRQPIIEKIFSSGEHDNVLVLGYSCSDIFDISPQIEHIDKDFKKVYFCEHKHELDIGNTVEESIIKKQNNNPFRLFSNGVRFYINTDKYIESLIHAHNIEISGDNKHDVSPDVWKKEVSNWVETIVKANSNSIRHHIIARLLMKSSQFSRAVEEMHKSLLVSVSSNKYYLASLASNNIGICNYRMGSYREAIKYHRRSLNFNTKENNKFQGQALSNIGNVLFSANKLKFALSCQLKALEIAKNCEKQALISSIHGNIGIIYKSMKLFSKAKKHHMLALKISEEIGDIISITRHNYNIGVVLTSNGEEHEGIQFYIKALDTAKNTAQKDIQVHCLYSLGLSSQRTNNFPLAVKYFDQSLALMKETGERTIKNECLEALTKVKAMVNQKS